MKFSTSTRISVRWLSQREPKMSNRQIAKFSRHSRRYVNGVINHFNATGDISIPRHVKPHSVRSSLSELDMDWIIRVSSEEPETTPAEMCNKMQVEMVFGKVGGDRGECHSCSY
jgi:hypothetical protein